MEALIFSNIIINRRSGASVLNKNISERTYTIY